ncbi:stage II sporulation protein M [Frankia sp. AiPs1]|uniref:stage II sporulation protein M n=1 Tax=Frankia sp. AiPa1 TaxID=573492 RepID=UPI00202B2351|nr:stage II sporulation protein M [Frankia sp. AiPa1]MCL9757655.1 stage II sporulation protein M [Frankia sp. AiPa1]
MDLDAYVAVHRPEWVRLGQLVDRASRPRRMRPAELDELVDLYQRTATHLSVIRTRSYDTHLVDDLTNLVTRARAAVAGASDPGWHVLGRFLTVTFPLAVYQRRWWVLATAGGSVMLSVVIALWIVNDPQARAGVVPPSSVEQLCRSDFASYYSENPASSFASQVWTNNAWVSAAAVASGALLGIPTLLVLLTNAVNVGVVGGYMAGCGQSGQFFSLILPHGLLELTVVFIAGAVGLRLGWSIIAPGPRRRLEALAAEGRAAVPIVLGAALALAVSGAIEAFVTPSGLPTVVRLGIGTLAWAGFVAYVVLYGSRAAAAGETADLDADHGAADLAPVV